MQVNRGPVDCGFIVNQVFVPHLKLQHRGSASSAFFFPGSRKQNEQFDGACGCGNHAEPDLFFEANSVEHVAHTVQKCLSEYRITSSSGSDHIPHFLKNHRKLLVNERRMLVQWIQNSTVLKSVWNTGQC